MYFVLFHITAVVFKELRLKVISTQSVVTVFYSVVLEY